MKPANRNFQDINKSCAILETCLKTDHYLNSTKYSVSAKSGHSIRILTCLFPLHNLHSPLVHQTELPLVTQGELVLALFPMMDANIHGAPIPHLNSQTVHILLYSLDHLNEF